jgi:hypothetical protein
MRPLAVDWTKRVPEDRKPAFVETIRNSTTALGRLWEILDEWEDDLTRQETKVSDFDTPNWELRCAYRLGDRSRIRKLRDLLSFLKGETE